MGEHLYFCVDAFLSRSRLYGHAGWHSYFCAYALLHSESAPGGDAVERVQ